jgi:pimeloyl-ACP methyl ester carboxylesterase
MPRPWYQEDLFINGIKIHYHRTRGMRPPLLLAHGFTDNGLCWTRLAKKLEPHFDLIMVDARGHGHSGAPESGYSAEQQASDLAGVTRALGLRKPGLIGHSMGANTVATAAASYPELVACAILEDPPWQMESAMPTLDQLVAARDEWRDGNLELKRMSLEEVVSTGLVEHPDWDQEEWLPWAESKQQVSLNAFREFAAIWLPWQFLLRRITCPILLITGDPESGAIVTPEVVREASTLWQDGQVVHCPGAGHSIRRERFEEYGEAILAFLKQIEWS